MMPTPVFNHFIDGAFQPPASQEYLPVFEPAAGQVWAQVAAGNATDVEAAVAAAEAARDAWKHVGLQERATLLARLADAIDAHAEELAHLESRDSGKPLSLARQVDIPRAAANFRFFSSALLHTQGSSFSTNAHTLNYTLHPPLGVVACISPWNLPLYLFTWKVAPALAAGNTVVAKPSELTPATATRLAQLVQDVGFPAGVFNLVHGLGPQVGPALVEHPRVKAISFTGGTHTGADIAQRAAPRFKKLSLELGGKNAAIVFDDANLERTIPELVRASFSNQGEICLCASRILVQRGIYGQFRSAFVQATRELIVGDPAEDSTRQGALVSAAHQQKILSYIALAQQEGGKLLCGGHAVQVPGRCQQGWFVAPTVLEDLPNHCRTNQEEIFGPVVTLQAFDSEQEAVALANDVRYGLSASIWTENLGRAQRVAAAVEAGVVWVNCWMLRDLRTPFGGMKDSGVGREGGFEALRFFTDTKNVCIQTLP